MSEEPMWQCANCHTLVEQADTDRCPTCGHVFFYPVAAAVADSEGSGSIRVEDFDVREILEGEETVSEGEPTDEDDEKDE